MSRRRKHRGGWRSFVLLAAFVAAVLAAGAIEGPQVARQVWSLVGVRAVEGHAEVIRQAARESAVDPCLLAAIMYVESRGRVDAESPRGALGLFQLVPAAASDAARRLHLPEPGREELLADAGLNARLGAAHLAWLIANDGPDLERVLVAYNAGRSRVRGWIRDAGSWEAWREERIRAGDSDVLAYARQVLEFRDRFRERGVIEPAVALAVGSSGEETGLPE